MKRARRLIAIVIVGVLAVGCGDSAPVVAPTPGPSLGSGVATSAPTAPAPSSGAGPSSSPSGSATQATLSPSPTPGSDWTALRWAQPVTISATALPADILFWQGAYVAVGSDGDRAAAWTSPDFATWTPASLDGLPLKDTGIGWPIAGPGGGLVSLGVHGRLQCGTGAGATCDPLPVAIWTSEDGQSWHGRAAPPAFKGAAITMVATGPGGIVAVGDTGWDHPAIWFSVDGADWSKETLPAAMFRHAEFSGLTAYRDRWVLTGLTDPVKPACCTGSDSKELKAAAWFSEDGRSWSRASVEPAGEETIFFPFAGSGGLDAGGFGWIWLSADGSSWRPDPGDAEAGAVAGDGERIIGESRGDDDGLELWLSRDGSSWQALADVGDVASKPSWNDGVSVFAKDYFLLPTGLAIIGWDAEDGTEPMWLATPTSAP